MTKRAVSLDMMQEIAMRNLGLSVDVYRKLPEAQRKAILRREINKALERREIAEAKSTKDRRKLASAAPHAETPTVQAMRHGDYEAVRLEMNGPKVVLNRASGPLGLYYRLGKIDGRQRAAGEEFERAYRLIGYTKAGRDPVVAMMDLGIVVRSSGPQEALLAVIGAERVVDRIRSRLGPHQYSTLLDVVISLQHLGRSEGRGVFRYLALSSALSVCADEFGVAGNG